MLFRVIDGSRKLVSVLGKTVDDLDVLIDRLPIFALRVERSDHPGAKLSHSGSRLLPTQTCFPSVFKGFLIERGKIVELLLGAKRLRQFAEHFGVQTVFVVKRAKRPLRLGELVGIDL